MIPLLPFIRDEAAWVTLKHYFYYVDSISDDRHCQYNSSHCLISVDGTYVLIPQQGPAIPGNPFSSFKFKGKCELWLWYKIVVDILAGNIMWINGPYAAGKNPDIKFLCSGFVHFLDAYERVGKQTMDALARLRKRSSAQGAHRIWPKIKRCRTGCGVDTSLSMGDWKIGRFWSQCTLMTLWNMGIFFGSLL